MDLLANNFQWMTINVLLAVVPLFLTALFIKENKKWVGVIIFILWLLFVPNTIYLLTDIEYLPRQFSNSNFIFDITLLLQYLTLIILGIYTYLTSMRPIAKLIKNPNLIIIPFNFFIAFGVAIGKIQRTESWDVIFNPTRVITDINTTLNSPALILFVILFGILINFIWISSVTFNDKR